MVTDYIKKAYSTYKRNFSQIMIAIILFIAIVGILIFGAVLSVSFLSKTCDVPQTRIILSFIFSFCTIFGIVFIFVLSAGLIKMYATALRRKTDFRIMFRVARQKFCTILGANILALIIIAGILFMLMTPSFIILLITMSRTIFLFSFLITLVPFALIVILFTFVNQAVVIDDNDAVNAVKKSINVIKKNYLPFLTLILMFVALSVLTSVFFYYTKVPTVRWTVYLSSILNFIVNWLIIYPIAEISYTLFYIKKR